MDAAIIRQALEEKYLAPTRRERPLYSGIEVEMPILNLKKEAVDFDIVHKTAERFMDICGFVPEKLAAHIQAQADSVFEDEKNSKSEQQVYFDSLRGMRFQVTGVNGWKGAQCTCGGVKLDQVFERTMASRLHKGLYFAGEILDECYPCGGFNLTQAFFTGLKAGKAMALAVRK